MATPRVQDGTTRPAAGRDTPRSSAISGSGPFGENPAGPLAREPRKSAAGGGLDRDRLSCLGAPPVCPDGGKPARLDDAARQVWQLPKQPFLDLGQRTTHGPHRLCATEVVLAILDEGSVSAAARRLGMMPSGSAGRSAGPRRGWAAAAIPLRPCAGADRGGAAPPGYHAADPGRTQGRHGNLQEPRRRRTGGCGSPAVRGFRPAPTPGGDRPDADRSAGGSGTGRERCRRPLRRAVRQRPDATQARPRADGGLKAHRTPGHPGDLHRHQCLSVNFDPARSRWPLRIDGRPAASGPMAARRLASPGWRASRWRRACRRGGCARSPAAMPK